MNINLLEQEVESPDTALLGYAWVMLGDPLGYAWGFFGVGGWGWVGRWA